MSVRIIQVIFALGVALIIYGIALVPHPLIYPLISFIGKYILFILAVIPPSLVLLFIIIVFTAIFMVTRDRFANFINDLLLKVFIEEVTKSDSGTTINIEKLIGLLEDILFKNRNIVDDIQRYVQGSKAFLLLLIAPSISLFFIYVLGLLLILFIFKPPLNFADILYIGFLLIIISFAILIAQGELELESFQSDRGTPSLSTPIINASNEVLRKYIYGNIQWRARKSLLLPMITLARLLPTFKIESVKPMHLVRLYVCRQGSNNQGYSLDNLINKWLKMKEDEKNKNEANKNENKKSEEKKNDDNKNKKDKKGDNVHFVIQSSDSTLSICDPKNVVKDVDTLTMSPYEFLNIISGRDNRGKPIIMRLVRRNKDGSETTLVFISMVAWNGCLTKKRIRNNNKNNRNKSKKDKSNIQLIGRKVTVVSVFMIGLAEYVTLLDSELTLHARPVNDESLMCEEDPP